MSLKYKKYTYDYRALDYFKRELFYGHSLDTQLVDFVNNNNGEMFAFLPKGASLESTHRFSGGGVARRDESLECITCVVNEFLSSGITNVCLLEDVLSGPCDQFSLKHGVSMLSLSDEVYLLLRAETKKAAIKSAIKEADQPNYFVGILSSVPSVDYFPLNATSISSNQIKTLVGRAEKILFGAFDGEGYLIWSKR